MLVVVSVDSWVDLSADMLVAMSVDDWVDSWADLSADMLVAMSAVN